MAYDFKPFEKRIKEIEERLQKELAGVRTGIPHYHTSKQKARTNRAF